MKVWQRKVALKARARLVEHFPLAFAPKGEPKTPLKIGIDRDIKARSPKISECGIRLALSDYCQGVSYHAALIEGAVRIDLDGQPAGTVTAAEAEHAAKLFSEFSKETQQKWRPQLAAQSVELTT